MATSEISRALFVEVAAMIDRERRHLAADLFMRSPAQRNDDMRTIADGLADIFAAHNPRFDRERFLKACGFSS